MNRVTPKLLSSRAHELYVRSYSDRTPDVRQIVDSLHALLHSDDYYSAHPNTKSIVLTFAKLVPLALEIRGIHCPDVPVNAVAGACSASRWPMVVTSINPFGRTSLQMSCFQRWNELGFKVVTCNARSEIEPLLSLGVDPASIVELDDSDTGLSVHGKPVPKILSVIEKVDALSDHDILLVNSDLFPEAEDGTFVEAWKDANTPLALVRVDQLSLGAYVSGMSSPYTNGLDAFLLPRGQVRKLITDLRSFNVSERMCFGIVGWDFLLGALILRNGGMIRHGDLLVHQHHDTTYTEISEFDYYNEAMNALGYGVPDDYLRTAEIFASNIKELCILSRQTYPSRRMPQNAEISDLLQLHQTLFRELEALVPEFVAVFGRSNIIGLLKTVSDRSDLPLADIFGAMRQLEPMALFSLYFIVFLARNRLDTRSRGACSSEYPPGNAHAAMVSHIRRKFSHDPALLRNAVAELFLIELMDYNIFNARLFNYLVLCAENGCERNLLRLVLESKNREVAYVA